MSHFAMDMDLCGFQDPQSMLSKALQEGKLNDFVAVLERDADPARVDDKHMSVFEKTLQTAGRADFISECLRRGCQVNGVNKFYKKSPVYFAIDSKDPSNLAALLPYCDKSILDRTYDSYTPLNSLAKNIRSDENADNMFQCMKLLIRRGADPNLPDDQEKTPILRLIENEELNERKKREIIEYLLSNAPIDLDTFRDGEARDELSDMYPDLKLPQPIAAGVTFELLMMRLRNSDEQSFVKEFQSYQSNRSSSENQTNLEQEENIQFLFEAIKQNLQAAVQVLLKTNVNVNAEFAGLKAVRVAAVWGNWQALRDLLSHDQIAIHSKDDLLSTVVKHLDDTVYNNWSDYSKCFSVLLDSGKIDINATDTAGMTPLHYAVLYKNEKASLELLQRGAYIGARSKLDTLPISEINPEWLEQHFDSCITTNDAKPGHENFEIQINFKNLIPVHDLHKEEMLPVSHIAESKDLLHLLQHPLITSFLFLKWHRLSLIFYVNLVIYSLFCLSLISFIILRFNKSENTALLALLGLLTFCGTIYLIARELLQFIISPQTYVRSVTNLAEIVLIVLTIVNLSNLDYDKESRRVTAVFTILLAASELCLLVGSLPVLSISTHMLMLRSVTKTFMKCFTLYSIFIITFSLCFYILFGTDPSKPGADGDDDDDSFNKFANPYTALIKTIVMLTGEFDASSIHFNSGYSYFVFLLFVFFMAIVLFNLLNGLAVSDTQIIKAQAELNGSICRAMLLRNYERVLTGRDGRTSFLVTHRYFRKICKYMAELFPHYIAGQQISIRPNENNRVLIPSVDSNGLETEMETVSVRSGNGKSFMLLNGMDATEKGPRLLESQLQTLPCCCSCLCRSCSEIDSRTVKTALAIIDKKAASLREKRKEIEWENRLRTIESTIAKVYNLLQKK